MRTQRPSLHLVQTPLGVPRPYTHLLALLCAVPSGTNGDRDTTTAEDSQIGELRAHGGNVLRESGARLGGVRRRPASPLNVQRSHSGARQRGVRPTRSHAHGVPARLPLVRGAGPGGAGGTREGRRRTASSRGSAPAAAATREESG